MQRAPIVTERSLYPGVRGPRERPHNAAASGCEGRTEHFRNGPKLQRQPTVRRRLCSTQRGVRLDLVLR